MAKKNVHMGAKIELQAPAELPQLGSILQSLPPDLVENLPLIVNRLNSMVAFYNAVNLQRVHKLLNTIRRIEELLYEEQRLAKLDLPQLLDLYKHSRGALVEVLEMSRKIAEQVDANSNKHVDEVYKLLESLSPEALAEIKSLLPVTVEQSDTAES